MKLIPRDINNSQSSFHKKTWGFELWLENCDEYCGKILRFEPGTHSSMHFHIKKLETMFVNFGVLTLEMHDPDNGEFYSIDLENGKWIQIPRGQPHRLMAKYGPVELIEFSTKHEEQDSYRVSESYKGKTDMNIPPYGRRQTFDMLKNMMLEKKSPTFVEVGTIRIKDNWEGDGYSTALFSYIAKQTGGQVYSLDVDPAAVDVSKEVLKQFDLESENIHVLNVDALEYLKTFDKNIDVLYLDAWDPQKLQEKSPERHLECFTLVEHLLNPGCLVLVDDMLDLNTLTGKGQLLIPYCKQKGYEVLVHGYTYMLRKPL